MKLFILSLKQKLSHYIPALFFVGGFVWDALTIGRNVAASDLIIFAIYLIVAGIVMFTMSRPAIISANEDTLPKRLYQIVTSDSPYLLLQFLFGSLLSALFILYFKSSSHWLAWILPILLAALLISNEFLASHYRRFTLSWALFGLCAMLLFNFALPFLLGSVWAVWFYLSTLLGAALAYFLYAKTPLHLGQRLGNIWPVGVIAVLLMLAYSVDMIPPVPLVKRDMLVAYDIKKVDQDYFITQQRANKWEIWQKTTNALTLNPDQRIYCFSSVFAPKGLKTRLFHRWQIATQSKGEKKWLTQSYIGFDVNGGRDGGYRGYTYKQNMRAGKWRVVIETETGKTIATHQFTLTERLEIPQKITFKY